MYSKINIQNLWNFKLDVRNIYYLIAICAIAFSFYFLLFFNSIWIKIEKKKIFRVNSLLIFFDVNFFFILILKINSFSLSLIFQFNKNISVYNYNMYASEYVYFSARKRQNYIYIFEATVFSIIWEYNKHINVCVCIFFLFHKRRK